MNQKTFQIMYNALVEIASSSAFFDSEKELVAIAKKALKQIAMVNDDDGTPSAKTR